MSFLFLSLGNIHWAYILWQTCNEMLLKFEIPTEKKHEDVTIFCNNLNVFFYHKVLRHCSKDQFLKQGIWSFRNESFVNFFKVQHLRFNCQFIFFLVIVLKWRKLIPGFNRNSLQFIIYLREITVNLLHSI